MLEADNEIIHFSPIALILVSSVGVILQRNPAYARLMGEFAGKNLISELPHAFKNAFSLALSLADSGPTTSFEIAAGERPIRNVYALSAKKLASGNVAIWIETLTKLHNAVEELATAKKEFDLATRAFPDLYFWIRADGTIFRCLLGQRPYVPEEKFLHRRMQDVLPEAIGEKFEKALTQAFSTGKTQELSYGLPTGESSQLAYYSARIVPDGVLQGVIIVRDMSNPDQTAMVNE